MHVLGHCSERHPSPTEGAFEEGILARRRETTQKWITSLLDASCRRPTATTQSFPLRRGREHCAEAEVGATGWWCGGARSMIRRSRRWEAKDRGTPSPRLFVCRSSCARCGRRRRQRQGCGREGQQPRRGRCGRGAHSRRRMRSNVGDADGVRTGVVGLVAARHRVRGRRPIFG